MAKDAYMRLGLEVHGSRRIVVSKEKKKKKKKH
jgi:hypothetical protein